MIYNDFQGVKLSALGMGNMRLPVIDDDKSNIDEIALAEMFEYCMSHGVNYYDTAYGYHEGQSEIAVGRALQRYPRESFYLASKFPGFNQYNIEHVEEIFEKQLQKCQVEYFDFYLFHSVTEKNIDDYLNPKYGIFDYLMKQKKNGRIHHLGFSAHADLPGMERFLEAYGKDMEFCQIQLNYFDWTYQRAKEKVELLKKWNIPVWVMEPVRGGQLASLDTEDEMKLKAARPNESVVAWAFRFLQSLPEVKVILSGMSNLQQVKENIATFEENLPLNEKETAILLQVAQDIISRTTVPCTACHYCESYCPMQLPIPALLKQYNRGMLFANGKKLSKSLLDAFTDNQYPDHCIGCRQCEAQCPQHIAIPDRLAEFTEKLEK